MDEVEEMQEAVAKEYGFALFRQYSEEQAAHFIRKDHSTLKRWRRKGLVPYVNMGERGVAYLGVHIAKMLIKGIKE